MLGLDAQADCSLERVVDPPLQASQCADHDNTGAKAAPDTAEAKLRKNLAGALGGLGHLGHHGISRMRHNGTSNTSNVARGKGNAKMGGLGVGLLGLGEHVQIEHLLHLLEEEELGHGVGNLTRPKRHDRAERELVDFTSATQSCKETGWESARGGGLHLDLDHFQWAQGYIGKEFSRGRTGKPDHSLVLLAIFLTCEVGIKVLEVLIETEFEAALSRVTQQSRQPTLKETSHSLFLHDSRDSTGQALVLCGVNLHIALGYIQRSDSQVSKTTGKNTAHAARQVVISGVGVIVRKARIPLCTRDRGSS